MTKPIHELIYERDGRIYCNPFGTELDVTSWVINVTESYYRTNNYHVTKAVGPENRVKALMYSEDNEVVSFVENFYGIKKEDYRSTFRKAESLLYQLNPNTIDLSVTPNAYDIEE